MWGVRVLGFRVQGDLWCNSCKGSVSWGKQGHEKGSARISLANWGGFLK